MLLKSTDGVGIINVPDDVTHDDPDYEITGVIDLCDKSVDERLSIISDAMATKPSDETALLVFFEDCDDDTAL